MKTKNNLILTLTFFFALGAAACGTKTEYKNSVAVQPTNKTMAAASQPELKTTNDNQSETARTEIDKSSADGSLATPTEAYKTSFAARQKKDLKVLKRVLSKQMLDFFTDIGKDEKKTLDDELKELADQPQAAAAEARNEKIEGDRATLEYLDERGKWKPMDLVKENGEWKLTMPAAPSAVVENTAKK